MISLLLTAFLAAFLSKNPSDFSRQLDALRSDRSIHSSAELIERLKTLTQDPPPLGAAGDALVWLGDLERQAGDRANARDAYRRALALPSLVDATRLAERGLGDLDLEERHFRSAEQHYRAALSGASPMRPISPILAEELRQKRERAETLWRRQIIEWIAWLVPILVSLYWGWQIRRNKPRLTPHKEFWFALPLYVLLTLGARHQEAAAEHALVMFAVASLLVLYLFGAAESAAPETGRVARAAWVSLAHGALFFAILNHLGLLDRLLDTLMM